MSRSRFPIVLLLLLSLASIANAQTRVDAGVAVGLQPHLSSGESPRGLPSVDFLARRDRLGIHVAAEYTDLSIGAMVATHANVVYRRPLGEHYAVLLGAGPTYVNVSDYDSVITWNAELELARTWTYTDLFARVRQYDYSFERFREQPASPSGLALYLGVRFRLTQAP